MSTLAARCTQYGYAFALDLPYCHAAATDVANAAMRKAGRKAWTEDDYNIAAETMDTLTKNAAGCFAEGKFMWPINAKFHGKELARVQKAAA